MAADSEEAFRAHVAALSTAERTAFVADLLRAEGRDVVVEGNRIEADDGTRARTLVVSPNDPDQDVDAVVFPRTGADGIVARLPVPFRGSGFDSDVEVLTADDLRLRLLYSIDRNEAKSLTRKHFGVALCTPEASSTSTPGRSNVPVGAVVLGLVLTVALVGGAVLLLSAGGFLGENVDAGDLDDQGTITNDGERLEVLDPLSVDHPAVTPPSEIDDGEDDVEITSDHRQTVDARSLSLSYIGPVRSGVPGVDLSTPDRGSTVEYVLRLDTNGTYHVKAQYSDENDSQASGTTVERYGTTAVEYRTATGDTNRTGKLDQSANEARPDSPNEIGTALLETYFDANETRIQDRGERLDYREEIEFTTTDDPASQHEAVAAGPPENLDDVDDFRAVAIVRADGLVERIEVSYLDTNASMQVALTVEFGSTTVPRPDWIEDD